MIVFSDLETLPLPHHRSLTSNVMSDAVEMTYLDRSKRRQLQQPSDEKPPTIKEVSAVPKTGTLDESQQPLTTQSTFADVSDVTTVKDTAKTKNNRKVSTTTNDNNRKNDPMLLRRTSSILTVWLLGLELTSHVSTTPDLQIPFYCGNHLVDITKGTLHLYKDK
jgi:hypothetical protein